MPSTSSPESGFTPRKEFIREQRTALNSFSLLALSGSSFIRLYSFPFPLVTALRHLFEQQSLITAFREDLAQNLCEFSLEGKPWATPKNVTTEKLLVEILAIIYQHGYAYLSTIDYGREHDDRLAMAFSKPVPLHSSPRSGSPVPGPSFPESSGSTLSHKSSSKRVPFALSFTSATLLRVISPPLHSTPAILQAVRGSWPRGVVSEKKLGGSSFEFKLKGYKWFQEDTFATDSLRHILSLLSSLDMHSFTLLTSISLTNRSRVKDLWIFTGPGSLSSDDPLLPESPSQLILDSSHPELKRVVHSPEPPSYTTSPTIHGSQHRRLVTAPAVPPSSSPPHSHPHTRAATDNNAPRTYPPNLHTDPNHGNQSNLSSSQPLQNPSTLLRKPAPRAQVPISVVHEVEPQEQEREAFRANLPSTISSTVENMTGVGAKGYTPDVFYATSPFGSVEPPGKPFSPVAPVPIAAAARSRSPTPPSRARSPLRPVSARAKTPPLLTSNTSSPRSSSAHSPPTPPGQTPNYSFHQMQTGPDSDTARASVAQPLLGPGVFRDSAFSSNTDASCEIPIKWTGLGRDSQYEYPDPGQSRSAKPSPDSRMSTGPILPGGWQPTPVEEKIEEVGSPQENHAMNGFPLVHDESAERPLQEVSSRVESPELTEQDASLRKSEAGLVGLITATAPPPPVPPLDRGKAKEVSSTGGGQGWVLVNVDREGKNSPVSTGSQGVRPGSGIQTVSRSQQSLPISSPKVASRPDSPSVVRGGESQKKAPLEQAAPNPAAKAIVIIDAVDAKNKNKPKSKLIKEGGAGSSSGMRGFFSLGRKNSKKVVDDGKFREKQGSEVKDDSIKERGTADSKTKTRTGFRQKLKLMGTPEAPRHDDRRRSID